MNAFLACFLAVICARIFGFVVQRTGYQIIAWRMRRRGIVGDGAGAFSPDAVREAHAQAGATVALQVAADAYATAPGQGTLNQLTEAAAAFGKTQTRHSREMRIRVAEMRARHSTP